MKPKNNIFPGSIHRIGDYIYTIMYIDDEKAYGYFMVEGKRVGGSYEIKRFQPVLITHDILGMLGFAGEETQTGFTVYEYSPTTTKLSKWTFEQKHTLIHPIYHSGFGQIQYVHQLQQIYLALHGVLLELK